MHFIDSTVNYVNTAYSFETLCYVMIYQDWRATGLCWSWPWALREVCFIFVNSSQQQWQSSLFYWILCYFLFPQRVRGEMEIQPGLNRTGRWTTEISLCVCLRQVMTMTLRSRRMQSWKSWCHCLIFNTMIRTRAWIGSGSCDIMCHYGLFASQTWISTFHVESTKHIRSFYIQLP